MARRLRFPLVSLIFLTARVASARSGTDQFRPEVFACEDALAHLVECCPELDPKNVRCIRDRHESGGCGSHIQYQEDPEISLAEAHCVLDLECGAIRDRGVCERAARMTPERSGRIVSVDHDPNQEPPEPPIPSGNAEVLCQ